MSENAKKKKDCNENMCVFDLKHFQDETRDEKWCVDSKFVEVMVFTKTTFSFAGENSCSFSTEWEIV